MNKEVQKSLDKLLEDVFNTKEYKEYKEAEDLWRKDKESQKMLEEYLSTKNTLNILEQGGFDGEEEQKKKLEELEEKVKNNQNINEWFSAQRRFQEFIWKQADYLSKNIKFPFSPKPRSSCKGGCG